MKNNVFIVSAQERLCVVSKQRKICIYWYWPKHVKYQHMEYQHKLNVVANFDMCYMFFVGGKLHGGLIYISNASISVCK